MHAYMPCTYEYARTYTYIHIIYQFNVTSNNAATTLLYARYPKIRESKYYSKKVLVHMSLIVN